MASINARVELKKIVRRYLSATENDCTVESDAATSYFDTPVDE
jgi:hypothetical protein